MGLGMIPLKRVIHLKEQFYMTLSVKNVVRNARFHLNQQMEQEFFVQIVLSEKIQKAPLMEEFLVEKVLIEIILEKEILEKVFLEVKVLEGVLMEIEMLKVEIQEKVLMRIILVRGEIIHLKIGDKFFLGLFKLFTSKCFFYMWDYYFNLK